MDVLTTIRSRRGEIAKNIAALQSEDAELAVAEKVIARIAPISVGDGSSAQRSGQPSRQVDYIVKTLAHMPERWAPDWSYLHREILSLFGLSIPKSSLMPYLTNLRNEGIIVRDGSKIALKTRVAKGAGPQSDGSYDPATAAADDDEDKAPTNPSRIRQQAEEIQRTKELEAIRRRNIRNVNS